METTPEFINPNEPLRELIESPFINEMVWCLNLEKLNSHLLGPDLVFELLKKTLEENKFNLIKSLIENSPNNLEFLPSLLTFTRHLLERKRTKEEEKIISLIKNKFFSIGDFSSTTDEKDKDKDLKLKIISNNLDVVINFYVSQNKDLEPLVNTLMNNDKALWFIGKHLLEFISAYEKQNKDIETLVNKLIEKGETWGIFKNLPQVLSAYKEQSKIFDVEALFNKLINQYNAWVIYENLFELISAYKAQGKNIEVLVNKLIEKGEAKIIVEYFPQVLSAYKEQGKIFDVEALVNKLIKKDKRGIFKNLLQVISNHEARSKNVELLIIYLPQVLSAYKEQSKIFDVEALVNKLIEKGETWGIFKNLPQVLSAYKEQGKDADELIRVLITHTDSLIPEQKIEFYFEVLNFSSDVILNDEKIIQEIKNFLNKEKASLSIFTRITSIDNLTGLVDKTLLNSQEKIKDLYILLIGNHQLSKAKFLREKYKYLSKFDDFINQEKLNKAVKETEEKQENVKKILEEIISKRRCPTDLLSLLIEFYETEEKLPPASLFENDFPESRRYYSDDSSYQMEILKIKARLSKVIIEMVKIGIETVNNHLFNKDNTLLKFMPNFNSAAFYESPIEFLEMVKTMFTQARKTDWAEITDTVRKNYRILIIFKFTRGNCFY